MARQQRARIVQVGFWQDADTKEMLAHTERMLPDRGT
mgnify:CR=1 FL=1